METLESIHRALERLSRWAVWAGGAALLLTAFMVTGDVLAQKFAGVGMAGSDEISGYVFGAATTWAYAYCLLHRSHIRIDALYNVLPLVVRAALDILGLVLLAAFMGYVTFKAVPVFLESWANNSTAQTTLATPLWIPQLFWVAGLILFIVTLAFLIVYCTVSLFATGSAAVQKLAGTMSVQEEVAEETRGIADVTAPWPDDRSDAADPADAGRSDTSDKKDGR